MGRLALEQVAFILAVAELGGGRPPPHEPAALHFIIFKWPIVREEPKSTNLAAADKKVHIFEKPARARPWLWSSRILAL